VLSAAPDVPGVEVLRVEAPARLWRWYHETYTIGTPLVPMHAEWRYRNALYSTRPVMAAFMEPGEISVEVRKFDEHETFRALLLSPAVMQEAAREVGVPAGDVHWREGAVNHAELVHDCMRLHTAFETDCTALERQARFTHLVGRLLGDFCARRPPSAAPAGEPAAVRLARDLLHERWDDNVQLDDLVALTGVGRFQLIRAFRAAVGVPPHAYQIHVRVARAKTLIRLGMPLADVALTAGFTDQSHLTRHFTRVIGVSPGRYRQAVR
jgi:AraC-like DNA-binding protein